MDLLLQMEEDIQLIMLLIGMDSDPKEDIFHVINEEGVTKQMEIE